MLHWILINLERKVPYDYLVHAKGQVRCVLSRNVLRSTCSDHKTRVGHYRNNRRRKSLQQCEYRYHTGDEVIRNTHQPGRGSSRFFPSAARQKRAQRKMVALERYRRHIFNRDSSLDRRLHLALLRRKPASNFVHGMGVVCYILRVARRYHLAARTSSIHMSFVSLPSKQIPYPLSRQPRLLRAADGVTVMSAAIVTSYLFRHIFPLKPERRKRLINTINPFVAVMIIRCLITMNSAPPNKC